MTDQIMRIFISAAVTEEERENFKKRAKELGMKESELIRQALANMGVEIAVEKERGAPVGNKNNPKGNPTLFESSPKYKKSKSKE